MAFDPEFLELMVHTCTLRPAAGYDLTGMATYGAALSPAPQCAVIYQTKQVYQDGLMVATELGVVYLDGSYDVDTSWGLEVPTPGGTRPVKIISVEQNSDEDGFHHTAVHFGAL